MLHCTRFRQRGRGSAVGQALPDEVAMVAVRRKPPEKWGRIADRPDGLRRSATARADADFVRRSVTCGQGTGPAMLAAGSDHQSARRRSL